MTTLETYLWVIRLHVSLLILHLHQHVHHLLCVLHELGGNKDRIEE